MWRAEYSELREHEHLNRLHGTYPCIFEYLAWSQRSFVTCSTSARQSWPPSTFFAMSLPKSPVSPALADPDRTRMLLSAAGLTDINIESIEKEIYLGKDVDEAMEFQQHVGPLSALLAETKASKHEELIAVVRNVFEPLVESEGIRLPAAVWLVSSNYGQ